MAVTPPYGQTDNTVVLPKGYTASQTPYNLSISSVSCAANTCTVTTSTPHGMSTGEWVHITGTGTDADVGPATISSGSQSGTTASLTASANVTFPNGANIFFEGSGLANIAGTFAAAGVSGASFTATVLESATRTFTCPTCTANYAVSITSTGASTFTYTKTGATGSASTGTVTGARMIPPAQGSTFVEPSFSSPPTIKVLANSSSATAGAGLELRPDHSTAVAVNADGTLMMLIPSSSGPEIWQISDSTLVRNAALGGQAAHARWDRVTPNKVWYRSGARLLYVTDIVASATGVEEHNFSSDGCLNIGISGPGTGTSDEGPGTTPGGRIALVCQTSTSPQTHDLIIYNTTTSSIEARYVTPVTGVGNVDYFHIIEKADGTLATIAAGVRWSNSGGTGGTLTNKSAAQSGGTVTVTGSGSDFTHISDGEKFRLFGCSDSDFNRLYTAASHTDTTVVATGTSVTATSATGCEVGTFGRGVVVFTKSGSTLVTNNILRWVGQHGQFGADAADEGIWVGALTNTGDSNGLCPTYDGGIISFKGNSADWTEAHATNNDSKVCLVDWTPLSGNSGAGIGISHVGWGVAATWSASSSGANGIESTLAATWDTSWYQRPGEGELSMFQLVDPGAVVPKHRLLHIRQHMGNDGAPRWSITPDGRYLAGSSYFRYETGGNRPLILFSDLTAWATGGIALTSISPEEGVQNTVVGVTLTGTGMDGANPDITVSGTGVTVSNLVQGGATSWTADFTIAAGAATGARTVTVTTDDGTSNTVTFSVTAAAAPTLSNIYPQNTCVQGTAVNINLSGANFDTSAVVAASGTGVTAAISFVSATLISATMTCAADATLGTRTVTVTTDAGASGTVSFIVLPKATVGYGHGVG